MNDTPYNNNLEKLLQIGNKVRIVYQPSEVTRTKVVHIRTVVDNAIYVVCYWSKKGQMWIYSCMRWDEFAEIEHRLEFAGVSDDFKELARYRKKHPCALGAINS